MRDFPLFFSPNKVGFFFSLFSPERLQRIRRASFIWAAGATIFPFFFHSLAWCGETFFFPRRVFLSRSLSNYIDPGSPQMSGPFFLQRLPYFFAMGPGLQSPFFFLSSPHSVFIE